ncbi:hypothetical protein [Tardiphaga sp.]|uniref:hypothetical protein n=1 Tax=Tardiphaga sp. TaxID=1926292 RepID=UPI0026352134|nr:hypothetical protein [Tardiphaga sp.]
MNGTNHGDIHPIDAIGLHACGEIDLAMMRAEASGNFKDRGSSESLTFKGHVTPDPGGIRARRKVLFRATHYVKTRVVTTAANRHRTNKSGRPKAA